MWRELYLHVRVHDLATIGAIANCGAETEVEHAVLKEETGSICYGVRFKGREHSRSCRINLYLGHYIQCCEVQFRKMVLGIVRVFSLTCCSIDDIHRLFLRINHGCATDPNRSTSQSALSTTRKLLRISEMLCEERFK